MGSNGTPNTSLGRTLFPSAFSGLSARQFEPGRARAALAPGETLGLALTWSAREALEVDYAATVQVLGTMSEEEIEEAVRQQEEPLLGQR